MITVKEAQQIIESVQLELEAESVALVDAHHRILQEALMADRDFPAYDRVTMDGIAIQHAQFEQGQRGFPIASMQPAGSPQQKLSNPADCVEVMTGAICPKDADSVIRYEDLDIQEKGEVRTAIIQLDELKYRQNIHQQGTDRLQGEVLCEAGRRIGSAEIAIAATIGKSQLRVSRLPKVAIISTGDELVEVDQAPLAHQIRRSNSYMISVALQEIGAEVSLYHFMDDQAEIREKIARLLAIYDVLILSGGVSMGKADYVPMVLDELGVEKLFHKVRQRPGKPFWFGKRGQRVVFALPGNPVSSFAGCYKYILPWLRRQIGEAEQPQVYAVLKKKIVFRPSLIYFAQVQVSINATAQLIADPIEGHGSGDHANLLRANALLELPGEDRNEFLPGEVYPLILFRSI